MEWEGGEEGERGGGLEWIGGALDSYGAPMLNLGRGYHMMHECNTISFPPRAPPLRYRCLGLRLRIPLLHRTLSLLLRRRILSLAFLRVFLR